MESFSILFHLRNGNFPDEIQHLIQLYICLPYISELNKHICLLTSSSCIENDFEEVIGYRCKIQGNIFKLYTFYCSESGYSCDEGEDDLPISRAIILSFKKQKYDSHLNSLWFFGYRCNFDLFEIL